MNIVIAISVFGFTFFVCWGLFYFAMILRQVFKVIKETRDRMHKVDELMQAFKEKIEHSASYLLLIGEGIKKLVEIAKEYNEKRNK